jgi:hypothetical protein
MRKRKIKTLQKNNNKKNNKKQQQNKKQLVYKQVYFHVLPCIQYFSYQIKDNILTSAFLALQIILVLIV